MIENYVDLYIVLRQFTEYFQDTKALMNDEFRAMLEKAEKTLEKTKP